MKIYTLLLFIFIAPALGASQPQFQRDVLPRPDRTSMGLALSVSQQDAAQIGGYGLGPGLEFFIRRTTASPFLLSVGGGVISLNDGIFKIDKVRRLLLPSLNIKAGYYIFKRSKFSLNPYFGLHGFSVMTRTKTETGIESSERSFQGGALMGLALTISVSYPTYLYVDMGVRDVLFSSNNTDMTFSMVAIGLVF